MHNQGHFVMQAGKQLSPLLPQIIPQVSNCIYDSKKQVQTAGLEALNEACRAISNEDIRHLTPQLVSVIARPDESAATLDSLLETTFVATGNNNYITDNLPKQSTYSMGMLLKYLFLTLNHSRFSYFGTNCPTTWQSFERSFFCIEEKSSACH